MQPNPEAPHPEDPHPEDPHRAVPPGARRPGHPGPAARPNLLVIRALIGALALTLGVVLLVQGNVLVGALLAALAVLRLGAMVVVARRRSQWRAAVAARRSDSGSGPGRST